MEHCLAKIREILARKECDRRAIFQLGYNLGRLSELSQKGRELCWDPWKDAVDSWNLAKLEQLAQELHEALEEQSPPLP